ncbi:hypothetical protein QJS04_geneDACA005086 [Acorus gramineus]|uniref:Thioredoxin superfamily protein n=1 Tax=Acorus gramineus TaxID=55184 RepID=A0AAV9AX83_ACOGR|nr:hypothetical protein QJS04_geneDACA005086 [Acorus gramineus]
MGEQSFLDVMLSHLRSTSKYYTGYPKELGPSRVVHFTSERQFVQLLHEGRPVVVAFTIKCAYTRHLDKVLEEAAAEFHPHVKFVRDCFINHGECDESFKLNGYSDFEGTKRAFDEQKYVPSVSMGGVQSPNFYEHSEKVECPKYPGFCITRQKDDYPFIEIFHSPEQAGNQGRTPESNITKYAVKVLPFNYDTSAYGFREFFKRHGIRASDSS